MANAEHTAAPAHFEWVRLADLPQRSKDPGALEARIRRFLARRGGYRYRDTDGILHKNGLQAASWPEAIFDFVESTVTVPVAPVRRRYARDPTARVFQAAAQRALELDRLCGGPTHSAASLILNARTRQRLHAFEILVRVRAEAPGPTPEQADPLPAAVEPPPNVAAIEQTKPRRARKKRISTNNPSGRRRANCWM